VASTIGLSAFYCSVTGLDSIYVPGLKQGEYWASLLNLISSKVFILGFNKLSKSILVENIRKINHMCELGSLYIHTDSLKSKSSLEKLLFSKISDHKTSHVSRHFTPKKKVFLTILDYNHRRFTPG
jgi:hypothetical protein